LESCGRNRTRAHHLMFDRHSNTADAPAHG
jgi:hypothetical protein